MTDKRKKPRKLNVEDKHRLYETIVQRGEGGKSFREVAQTFGIQTNQAEAYFYEIARQRYDLLDGQGDALLSFVVDKLMALESVWQEKAQGDVRAAELVRSLLRDLSNLLDLPVQRKPVVQVHVSATAALTKAEVRAELEALTKQLRALPAAEPEEIIDGVATEVAETVPADEG